MNRKCNFAAVLALSISTVALCDIVIPSAPSAKLAFTGIGSTMVSALDLHPSKSGRYISFRSTANNLVPSVGNGKAQLFRADTAKNAIVCVSLGPNGDEFDDHVTDQAISSNGRYVAFVTRATNTGFTFNGFSQVYLDDVKTKQRIRCTPIQTGGGGNLDCDLVAISGNGRVVAFRSLASNLTNGVSNGKRQIFVFDTKSKSMERISETAAGVGADADIDSFALSGDGSVITFATKAHNLAAGAPEPLAYSDVFVHDRKSHVTSLVSLGVNGAVANGASRNPAISKNGRYVGFVSDANNLTNDDHDGDRVDGFFYDRVTNTLSRCEAFEEGAHSLGLSRTSISEDGRYLSVQAIEDIDDQVGGSYNSARCFDRVTKSTEVLRLDLIDSVTEKDSLDFSALCGDGKHLVFTSRTEKFEAPGTNSQNFFVMTLPHSK